MNLQNLQADFVEILFSKDGTMAGVNPQKNITIYQNNVISTLTNTLEQTYPLVAKLVGFDYFRFLVQDYIKRYPSRSSNLNDYGTYFADFLAECPALKELVYLSEVAEFEWLCHSVHCAAEPPALDTTTLATIAPIDYPNLHIHLHPACKVVKFYFPILSILDLCQGANSEKVDTNKGGIELLIQRRDYKIILQALTAADFAFLFAAQENLNINAAVNAALKFDQHFALPEKLLKWIKEKIIVAIA